MTTDKSNAEIAADAPLRSQHTSNFPQLLDELKGLYAELSFGERLENKSKLSKIRTLREEFNKDQKQKRDVFKKIIFSLGFFSVLFIVLSFTSGLWRILLAINSR